MELYERIRKDSREEGLGIRALAARHHVHRRDVREACEAAREHERRTGGIDRHRQDVVRPREVHVRSIGRDVAGCPEPQ